MWLFNAILFLQNKTTYEDLNAMTDMELYNFAKSNTVEFADIMHSNQYMEDIMCKYNKINRKVVQEKVRQEMMDELHLQESVEYYCSQDGQLHDLSTTDYDLKCARFTVKSEMFDKSIAEIIKINPKA